MTDFWKDIKHFYRENFNCPCCGKRDMKEKFIVKLDQARGIADIPFKITSGYRCEKHNAEIGGVSSSAHTKGYAADIECKGSRSRAKIVKACIEAGFDRIGIAKGFVHVDFDPDRPVMVYWVY